MKYTVNSQVTHDLHGPARVTAVLENAYEIQTESGVRMVALPQELRAATATPAKARRPLVRRAGITVIRMAPDGKVASVEHPEHTYTPTDPYSKHRHHVASGKEFE